MEDLNRATDAQDLEDSYQRWSTKCQDLNATIDKTYDLRRLLS